MYRILKRKLHNKSGTRVWLIKVTCAVTGNISPADCLKILPLRSSSFPQEN